MKTKADKKANVFPVCPGNIRYSTSGTREKMNPNILKSSRIRRIAKGSGTTEREVKELINQHSAMKKLMKSLGKRGLPPILRRMFDKTK